MGRETITETGPLSSRGLIRTFEVANHFAGRDIDRSATATITLSESGAMVISGDILDGVGVCFPFKHIGSYLPEGQFSFDTRFPHKVLKVGGKKGSECLFGSKDLFGDFPYLIIKGRNSSSRVTLRKGHEIFAFERERFREERLPDFEVTAGEFLSALETVKFAAKRRNSGLSGVMVDISPKGLKLTAVETYRLCQVVQERQKAGDETGNFVITSQCAEKLAWLLRTEVTASLQNPLRIYRNADDLKFSFLDYQLFAHVSDLPVGAVRNYEQYIPLDDQISTRIDVDARDLQQAISFAQPERVNCVTFSVCGTQFIVSSVGGPDVGEDNAFDVKAILDAEILGQEIVVKFDPRPLLEFLERVPEGKLEMGFSGPEKPVVFRLVGGKNLTYMLMPMEEVK